MRLRNVAKIAGLFLLGVLLTTLIHRRDTSSSQDENAVLAGSVSSTTGSKIEHQTEFRVADRIEASPTGASPGSIEPGDASPETDAEKTSDFQEFVDTTSTEGKAREQAREIEQLVSAGFSRERASWLRSRAAELTSARQHSRSVETDSHTASIYLTERDLDLMHEVGEEEYDRYRQALGRPIGVPVTEVSLSSALQAHGIQAGDEIVRINGSRTYNAFMVTQSIRDPGVGVSSVVEVKRDGQTLPIMVASESLVDLRMEMPGTTLLRSFRPPPPGTPQ